MKSLRQPPEQNPGFLGSCLSLNTGAEIIKKHDLVVLMAHSIREPPVDNHITGIRVL